MKLFRFVSVFLVSLLFSLLFPISGTTAPIKIGFILSTLQEERYQKDLRYFKEAAEKLGFEVIAHSGDNNELVQASKVENLLTLGVKALVVQPVNSQSAANFVKLAHDERIPVVSYDRMIQNAPVDYYVTTENFPVGVMQAEAAVKHTGGQGNYVILMGTAGNPVANEITAGALSVLKKYPKIKIVSQQSHDGWSPKLAMETVENVLTHSKNKIDAILANNSGMAGGAVQALAEQGLTGKVFVAGADADLSAIQNLVAGRAQLDVVKDIRQLAFKSAEAAYLLAKGSPLTHAKKISNGKFEIPSYEAPVYSVTKENLEARIFSTGFHARDAVYGAKKPAKL